MLETTFFTFAQAYEQTAPFTIENVSRDIGSQNFPIGALFRYPNGHTIFVKLGINKHGKMLSLLPRKGLIPVQLAPDIIRFCQAFVLSSDTLLYFSFPFNSISGSVEERKKIGEKEGMLFLSRENNHLLQKINFEIKQEELFVFDKEEKISSVLQFLNVIPSVFQQAQKKDPTVFFEKRKRSGINIYHYYIMGCWGNFQIRHDRDANEFTFIDEENGFSTETNDTSFQQLLEEIRRKNQLKYATQPNDFHRKRMLNWLHNRPSSSLNAETILSFLQKEWNNCHSLHGSEYLFAKVCNEEDIQLVAEKNISFLRIQEYYFLSDSRQLCWQGKQAEKEQGFALFEQRVLENVTQTLQRKKISFFS